MLTPLLLCLAACSLAPSAGTPTPASSVDAIPDGVKFVDVERIRELAPLREYCCVQYMIKEGDTFYGIARRETGKATKAAVDELIALNPGVDPKRLKIYQRIWLPAKKADAGLRYVFLTNWPGNDVQGFPFLLTGPLYARYGSFEFQIVEGEHLEEYLKATSRDALQAMEKDRKLQLLQGSTYRGMVDEDSEIASMEERIEVQRDEEGTFTLECTVKDFDSEGRLIEPDQPDQPGEPRKRLKDSGDELWLLLLGLGGAGLVFAGARKRAQRTQAVSAI